MLSNRVIFLQKKRTPINVCEICLAVFVPLFVPVKQFVEWEQI